MVVQDRKLKFWLQIADMQMQKKILMTFFTKMHVEATIWGQSRNTTKFGPFTFTNASIPGINQHHPTNDGSYQIAYYIGVTLVPVLSKRELEKLVKTPFSLIQSQFFHTNFQCWAILVQNDLSLADRFGHFLYLNEPVLLLILIILNGIMTL